MEYIQLLEPERLLTLFAGGMSSNIKQTSSNCVRIIKALQDMFSA